MKWIILAAVNWVATIICWITTPLIVLFCDEEGELDSVLHLWQTWDDSCYAEQMVTENAPEFLRYDWHSKYYTIEEDIPNTGRTRRLAKKYPWATFSLKERIQRYLCAVLWLWRNPAYGVSFYLLGCNVDCLNVKWIDLEKDYRFGYDCADGNGSNAWCYKDDRRINKYIRKSWYLGWKIPTDCSGVVRCMIASRLSLRFGKAKE